MKVVAIDLNAPIDANTAVLQHVNRSCQELPGFILGGAA